MTPFPNNFLWGASTSAFQIEGGYMEGGKGFATTDMGTGGPDVADNKVASGRIGNEGISDGIFLVPHYAGYYWDSQRRGLGIL